MHLSRSAARPIVVAVAALAAAVTAARRRKAQAHTEALWREATADASH